MFNKHINVLEDGISVFFRWTMYYVNTVKHDCRVHTFIAPSRKNYAFATQQVGPEFKLVTEVRKLNNVMSLGPRWITLK